MHVYFGLIKGDGSFYVNFLGVWFNYLSLAFYEAMLTMFWRLRSISPTGTALPG